jgi:hypothetical protein
VAAIPTCSLCFRPDPSPLVPLPNRTFVCVDCAEKVSVALAEYEEARNPPQGSVSMRSTPQGQAPYKFRLGYRAQFDKESKTLVVVPWQEKPPEYGHVRNLVELLEHMPYLAVEEARERTVRRRKLNSDEAAMLNWWFFSGGDVEGLRQFMAGNPPPIPSDATA